MKKQLKKITNLTKLISKEKSLIAQTIKKTKEMKGNKKISHSTSQILFKPKYPLTPSNHQLLSAKQIGKSTENSSRATSPIVKQRKMFYTPNLIPLLLSERLKFLHSIFEEESFVAYYNKSPQIEQSSLDEITKYLSEYKGTRGVFDTYAMFYYYLCHKMTFDYEYDPFKREVEEVIQEQDTKKIPQEEKPPGEVSNENENNEDEEIENEEEEKQRGTVNEIFESGLCLPEEFCKLYEYMCKYVHLRVKRIVGKCKLFPRKTKESSLTNNHCWNAIEIRGKYYFVDVTLGAGNYNPKKSDKSSSFNPYYFLTPGEYLINSHYPKDPNWQLLPKTILPDQYAKRSNLRLGDFYHQVYNKQIELVTHDYPYIIANDNNLRIEIIVKETVLRANVYSVNGKTKLSEAKYTYDEIKNSFDFQPTFPKDGDYLLKIVSRPLTSTDLIYIPLLEYKIHFNSSSLLQTLEQLSRKKSKSVAPLSKTIKNSPNRLERSKHPKQILDYNSILPNKKTKKICFDNSNAHLFEPKSLLIKIGVETRFKVRIKGIILAGVLDGRKMNYMKKKDDDIWEGSFVIQNENVCICSLKACNVITEVFEFKTVKT